MISQKTLKTYGFNSMNEYFNMIYLSVENGQVKQAKEQISKLSKSQKRDFVYFFIWDLSSQAIKTRLLDFLIEDLTK